MLCKNRLCHKGNNMKLTDFYVARKWYKAVLKITYTYILYFKNKKDY